MSPYLDAKGFLMSFSSCLFATTSAIALLSLPSLSHAAIAIDFVGGTSNLRTGLTLGYSFSLITPQLVTHLAVFDVGSDGLLAPHAVGVWDQGANLLSVAVVPAGPLVPSQFSTSGLGLWRTVDVLDFVLMPGNYFAGAYYGPNNADLTIESATAIALSGTIYNRNAATPGGALAFPAGLFPAVDDAFFGPGLIVAIPETGTAALLGAGLLLPLALCMKKTPRCDSAPGRK